MRAEVILVGAREYLLVTKFDVDTVEKGLGVSSTDLTYVIYPPSALPPPPGQRNSSNDIVPDNSDGHPPEKGNA